MIPWEGNHEEHYLFLVDSPGYHERARELSKGAGPLSIQKASKLGHAAESRGWLVGVEEATRMNVWKIAAGVLRNEMRPPSSAQPLMANPFTRTEGQLLFTWLVLAWSCIGRSELLWQNVILGQKPACVPDDDAVCCFMQPLSQHQSVGKQLRSIPFRSDSQRTLIVPGE